MDDEEEIGAKTEASRLRLPAFLQLHQKESETGKSKSPECIHHIALWFTRRWRPVQLKESPSSSSNGNQFGIRFHWGRRCFQSVCKNTRQTTSGTLTLFFFFLPFLFRTLSVGSDLKSSNIASSLILPILHLLLSVSLFLIYIYIFFSGFFFFSSFLTLQNERQNDGQLTIYIIIFLFLLSSGRT